jgi:hypothetical protein
MAPSRFFSSARFAAALQEQLCYENPSLSKADFKKSADS